ncbi:hypothetical protein M071_1023 [Bacteroides fragilis str. Ds-233]|nr:hypothetical protein M071_1023 [Bacteroides fragilis str. Ds-233]
MRFVFKDLFSFFLRSMVGYVMNKNGKIDRKETQEQTDKTFIKFI